MKFVIQRVKEAAVNVDGEMVGNIGQGLLVFVGISNSDDVHIADKMIDKMTKLRIFEDENGKTNLSISDVGGEFLIISQFTLYADCKKGNRPSFINAGKPEMANELYEYIISEIAGKGFKTEHGIFGADMKVSLINDGPFTILLDSSEIINEDKG
jgi:D-tyrosyl-tRNA(Tyr) deacylase